MRLMSAIHPTSNQQRVLAKIAAAPNPTVAGEQISVGSNMISARNMLMKLGMITFADNEAALTSAGTQVAQEENIIDQAGKLTKTGEQLAFTDVQNRPDSDAASKQPTAQPMEHATLLQVILR